MKESLREAIQSVQGSLIAYSKFITANDVGSNGAHQTGFHISKTAWPLLFDQKGQKHTNKDRSVTIKWQNDIETNSRFVYYGRKTRNEYRITRFGRGFPFLTDDNVGNLLVLCKMTPDYYHAYILDTDEDMEDFFTAVGITASEVNKIIPDQTTETAEEILLECFKSYIFELKVDFPSTSCMANKARKCHIEAFKLTEKLVKKDPDRRILEWISAEYQLFKMFENNRYQNLIKEPFSDIEQLVKAANTILNRRKSRAGKSLEHHLDYLFQLYNLKFESQAVTEGRKKPDFLFPGADAYHNPKYNPEKLVFLGAKTTCKDRWRQIISEADRIPIKYLFTLQPGVSRHQMKEMTTKGIRLVVPKDHRKQFAKDLRPQVLTLEDFINLVIQKQTE